MTLPHERLQTVLRWMSLIGGPPIVVVTDLSTRVKVRAKVPFHVSPLTILPGDRVGRKDGPGMSHHLSAAYRLVSLCHFVQSGSQSGICNRASQSGQSGFCCNRGMQKKRFDPIGVSKQSGNNYTKITYAINRANQANRDFEAIG